MTLYTVSKILKESFWLLTICILIEILAGQILNSQEKIINIPIILAAVPVVNGIGGNIGSIMGAKLTSGLHVGFVKPDLKDKVLRGYISDIILLAIIVFILIAVLMSLILPLIGIQLSISVFKFIPVIFFGGLIMTLIVIVAGVFSAFIAFKKGMDPDNVVTPIITTSGDTFGISIIILLTLLVIL